IRLVLGCAGWNFRRDVVHLGSREIHIWNPARTNNLIERDPERAHQNHPDRAAHVGDLLGIFRSGSSPHGGDLISRRSAPWGPNPDRGYFESKPRVRRLSECREAREDRKTDADDRSHGWISLVGNFSSSGAQIP